MIDEHDDSVVDPALTDDLGEVEVDIFLDTRDLLAHRTGHIDDEDDVDRLDRHVRGHHGIGTGATCAYAATLARREGRTRAAYTRAAYTRTGEPPGAPCCDGR